MRGLDSGKNKIQKICDALRVETLEPAKQEAKEIIENAHLQAAEILREAKEKIHGLSDTTDHEIEQKNKAFHSSIQLACRQTIEQIKQKIEEGIFFKGLADLVAQEMGDSQVIADLINAALKSLSEKGIEEDLSVIVPEKIAPRTINVLIVKKFLDKLKEKSVIVGEFDGGIQIKLHDQQITIDISDRALRELIAHYIRRDFRDLVFQG